MAAADVIFDTNGIAVITGGGSGFGLECAQRCVAAGMPVAIADVQLDALQRAEAELSAMSSADKVLAVQTDVSKEASVQAFAAAVVDKFPGSRISLLFNNAGVFTNLNVLHATEKDWRFVLDVNVVGVAMVIKAFVPRMITDGPHASGKPCHVVQTSSIAGLLPMQSSSYFSSKMAVTQITEALHEELSANPHAQHISLHTLHPAAARTSIWSSQRNRPAELEHEGTAASKAKDYQHQQNMNTNADNLTAASVIDALFAGIAAGDFYIKAITETQGGIAFINSSLQLRMEDQISGKRRKLLQPLRPAGIAISKL